MATSARAAVPAPHGAAAYAEGSPGADLPQPWGHWESWVLRLAILAVLAYQVIMRNRSGTTVAAEGLVVSLAPLVVQRWGRTHVLRRIELAFTLTIALQFVSESLKLYEIFYYWDKFAHPAEVFLATFMFGQLFLGYVDTYGVRLQRPFVAFVTLIFGATLGATWEFVEFVSDWFGNADLQKSNADTMTDILSNDIGALTAMLLAFWLYHHVRTTERQREELGHLARWLTNGIGRLLDRHGVLIGALFFLLLGSLVAAAWLVDRHPVPLPPGVNHGQPQRWSFTPAALPAGATVLSGEWQPDEKGVCRVNPQDVRPGSEKAGLLGLAPGSAYGPDAPFTLTARYLESRPPQSRGSQMTAGIAFAVRSPVDFYLLEASALHDFVRLDHFVHGRRRDLREKRVRTHGNEWHELQARIFPGQVQAYIDGRLIFQQTQLADLTGGIGLWARVSQAACFSVAAVVAAPVLQT